MKQFFSRLRSLLNWGVLFILALYLVNGLPEQFSTASESQRNPIVEATHRKTATFVTVSSALSEIGELATCQVSYTGTSSHTDFRTTPIFSLDIPFTDNHLEFSYSGLIKAGYEVDAIGISVQGEVIVITLPTAKVFSNKAETIGRVFSRSNLFNPLDGTEVEAMLRDAEAKELQKAIDDGLYAKAARSAQTIIRSALAEFVADGYDILFVN